jgi:hypothetical protein
MSRGPASVFLLLDWPLLLGNETPIGRQEVPRAVVPGLRVGLRGRAALTASLSVGIASDAAETEFDPLAAYPEWSLRLRIGTELVPFESDRDGDGIGDHVDRCPELAEDLDGHADHDGCPELDNDGDGIPDARDACPGEREDRDGYQDDDGCPELDNDQDGVPDQRDGCPDAPEDLDGFEDADGCPDPDNDMDDVPDREDACPDQAEDHDGDRDDDGCPD